MSKIYDYQKDGGPEWHDDEYENFYLKLRSKISSYIDAHPNIWFAEVLINVPDFFYMLFMLSRDPEVPKSNKAQIIGALAYFISPIDVIPDAIPGFGLLDDLYIAMIVSSNLLSAVPIDLINKYWPGEADVAVLIRDNLDKLNDKFGTGAIKRMLNSLVSYTKNANK